MTFRDLPLAGFYSAEDDRLNRFYVPVLSQAVAYDRMAGYFRSSALAIAAAGLSRFLAHDGRMRLIVGAELDDDDVQAALDGTPLTDVLARRLLTEPLAAENIVTERRLETLAWLVKEGRLEIRVGVPLDASGRALPRHRAGRYFHTKTAVFTDSSGACIALNGSVNESPSGWDTNHESFSAYMSWMPDVWSMYGAPIAQSFEDHWNGRPDRGWAVISLPDAVRDNLIARITDPHRPPPTRDPEEPESADEDITAAAADRERLTFIASAPRLDGGTGVGFATAGVEPWPHQLAIARRVVATWPRSYLLADEVGLGKTIEAGLILRELLVSGKATTALILTPASVLKQWQEELYEKFALDVPRLDRGRYWNALDIEIPQPGGNPWNAFPVLLASSHLAKRRSRRNEILNAAPWDIVFVDEAHHARRTGTKATGSPNTLLSLLQGMKTYRLWRALYLASATPMQMHPHEAWDLLELLGLHGRWAGTSADFVNYYTELREPFPDRRWPFLEHMAADYFADPEAQPDHVVEREIKRSLGNVAAYPILRFHQQGLAPDTARELAPPSRHWMDEWLRSNTPMHDRVFRTTRNLLRHYRTEGILAADTVIPERHVTDQFVPMTDAEDRLYQRIETYIARYYNLYSSGPGANKPLGFIMTVYRRRLTSSLYAIQRSLERRLAALETGAGINALFDADDLATLEYSAGFDPDALPDQATALSQELGELRAFLAEISATPPDESKMRQLHEELTTAFYGQHDTALIFTQYADTMDYIRRQLVSTYGSRVICYSGRGGERYDPATDTWQPLPKAEVKRLFREGHEVKILIGTDSLSEGLNLQTCAKLINYDMPWNFMRVEQRLGRIDRIGGRSLVEISNYFYRGTVEEQIYQGIAEDYDWFTDVVGPAQPVLGRVEQAIEDIAMRAPGADRDAAVQARVAEIRSAIEEAKARAITLGDLEGAPEPGPADPPPAITLEDLETILITASATRHLFRPHPTVAGVHILTTARGEVPVTFRRDVLAEKSPGVRLMTYGAWELGEVLVAAGVLVNT